MKTEYASRTALAAAAHRAVHQLLERGSIFFDPVALPILGPDGERLVRESAARPDSRRMRLFIAARTRFAEEALGTAMARGVRQLVILGAGLDTYAYRGSHRDRLRTFEVDHPATQAWKRERLRAVGIDIPATVSFVSVDFARDELSPRLIASGFDPGEAAFFSWLGVVPYLQRDAICSTLAYIAALPGRAHVVFDYSDPLEALAPETRAAREQLARRVAGLGEPWLSFFEPAELHGRLGALGFRKIDDRTGTELVCQYLSIARRAPPGGGAHVLHATTCSMPE
jgi:methyltransferase (TIGR00027 family)